MIGRIKAGGGSGALNVYAQVDEPTKKDGLWFYLFPEKVNLTDKAEIDYYFYNGDSAVYGTDIFAFGGSSYGTRTRKYDTVNNVWSMEYATIPNSFQYGTAEIIGNYAYLFNGSTSYNTKVYKYNISNNTYSTLSNFPATINTDVISAIVGTDIYIFNGSSNSYKFDTSTETYTSINGVYANSCVIVGTDIYLFRNSNAYKYDTLTDTYTTLASNPYSFGRGSAVLIGNKIYLLYGTSVVYYDITTNTYMRLNNLSYSFVYGHIEKVNNNIYMLGGTNDTIGKYNKLLTISELPYGSKVNYQSVGILNNSLFEYNNSMKNFAMFSPSFDTDVCISTPDSIILIYQKTIREIKDGTITQWSNSLSYNVGPSAYLNGYIYTFVSTNSGSTSRTCYRLNIKTKEINYDRMVTFYSQSVVACNGHIYCLGGNNNYQMYDYTAGVTKSNIPYSFNDSYNRACAVGTNIYLFFYSGSKIVKYDTLTDTYTELSTTLGIGTSAILIPVGTDIYISTSSSSKMKKFDTLTDTYTETTGYSNTGIGCYYDNSLYFFKKSTSSSGNTYYQSKTILPVEINDDVTIFSKDNIFDINLNDNTKIPLNYGLLKINGTVETVLPVYYGDGTSWNLVSWGI